MILFFSSTGNCRYTAAEISKKTGDEMIEIAERMKAQRFDISPADGENIGIITTVYDWILPSIVEEFLDKLVIHSQSGNHYTFLVVTYGTTPGCTAFLAGRQMKEKAFPFKGYYSIQLPDTWTPVFNLSDPKKVQKQNDKAEMLIQNSANAIAAKQEGDFTHRKLPNFIAAQAKANYERVRKTSHLHVMGRCIGCGLCAKNCPAQAIEMKNSRPEWVKAQCIMCLRCLHHCPKFAIQ